VSAFPSIPWIMAAAGCGWLSADGDGDSGAGPTRTTETGATETGSTDPQFEPSAIELDLYERVNAYRTANALPSVPLSPSLSRVARLHAEDQVAHHASFEPQCNLHSWSDAGAWTPCCYTSDHAEAECMWDKPRELTDYPGNGYEISSLGPPDAEGHLAGWQSSEPHDDVIMQRPPWTEPWLAMGVGVAGSHANIWFGREADPAGTIR